MVFNCLGNENGGILALPDATDADVAALEQRGALVQRTPGRAGESPAFLVQGWSKTRTRIGMVVA